MTEDIRNFHELLNKLKFVDPVSEDLQKEILKTKRDEFYRTLKTAGGYTFLFGIIGSDKNK